MAVKFDPTKVKSKSNLTNKKKGTLDFSKITSNSKETRRDNLSRYSDFASRYDSVFKDAESYLSRREDVNPAEVLPSSGKRPTSLSDAYALEQAGRKGAAASITAQNTTEWYDPAKADSLSGNIKKLSAEAKELLKELESDRQYMTEEGYNAYKEFLTAVSGEDFAALPEAITGEATFRKSVGGRGNYERLLKGKERDKKLGISEKTSHSDLVKLYKSGNLSDEDADYVESLINSRDYIDKMTISEIEDKISRQKELEDFYNENKYKVQMNTVPDFLSDEEAAAQAAIGYINDPELNAKWAEVRGAMGTSEYSDIAYYDEETGAAIRWDTLLEYKKTEEQLSQMRRDGRVSGILRQLTDQYESLTDDQRNQLYGHLTARGYDGEAVKRYFDYNKKREKYIARKQMINDLSSKNAGSAVLATIIGLGANIGTIGEGFSNAAQGVVDSIKGKESQLASLGRVYDDYAGVVSTGTQEAVTGMIDDAIKNEAVSWLATTAYSGITSAAQSGAVTLGATAAFGPAGAAIALGVLGSQAGAQAYNEAVKRGSTNAEALATGIASGTAEAFFERFSVESLIELKSSLDVSSLSSLIKSSLKNSKNLLVQGLIESSEELGTTIANEIADGIINGDKSGYNITVDRLIKQGYTKAEAEAQAMKEYVNEVASSVVGGFFGGLVGGAGAVATGFAEGSGSLIQQEIERSKERTERGEMIVENENVDELLRKARAEADDRAISRYTKKLERAQEKGREAETARRAGRLYDALVDRQQKKAVNSKRELFRAEVHKALEGKENAAKAEKVILKAMYTGSLSNSDVSLFEKAGGRGIINGILDSEEFKAANEDAATKASNEFFDTLSLLTDRSVAKAKAEIINDTADFTVVEKEKSEGITRLDSLTADDATVVTKDGKTVSAYEATLSEDEASVIAGLQYIASEGGISLEDANYVLQARALNPSLSATDYILGVEEALNYGKYSLSKGYLENARFAGKLNADVREFLYGKAEAEAKTEAEAKEAANKKSAQKAAKKNGGVFFEDGVALNADGTINTAGLTKLQKRSLEGITALASVSPLEYHIFRSEKVGGRYVATIRGEVYEGSPNGLYFTGTNEVWLDLNAGDFGEGTMLWTAGHEIAHYIREHSPAKFRAIGKFIAEEFAKNDVSTISMLEKQKRKIRQRSDAKNMTEAQILDLAYEEMIADSLTNVLTDGSVVEFLADIKKQDKTLWQTICDAIADLLKRWGQILNVYKGRTLETDEARALEAIDGAREKVQRMYAEAFADANESFMQDEAAEAAQKTVFGNETVSEKSTDHGVKNQLRNSEKIGQAAIEKNKSSKNVDPSVLLAGVEVMGEMADIMLPYLEEEGILPPDNPGKTIFKNGSYGRTAENALICVRTLTYEDFKDRVAEKIGRPLTVAESLLVSQKIYDIATEPQCIYCYVAADRKSYDEYLGTYWKSMDKYIKALKAGGDSKTLYNEYLDGRKDTKQQQARWKRWEALAKSGASYITQADLATKSKRDEIIAKGGAFAEQVKDAQRYAQSASWAKKVLDYRAYNGEILKMQQKFVDMLNDEYGLRMYSFSDYTPAFIVENMQMLIDASVRGLRSLAYTKDTDYAEIFAPTGQAINISCFAKLDPKTGEYVEDTRQGANWKKAQELRRQYKNVGAVMVATNDKMVEWALKQDWIDVVIPYHIVKTGTTIANEYGWRNYTAESADRQGNKAATIYPTEHNNDFATYKKLIEERGLTPRFSKWYDACLEGDITEEQYMKLVNEVRLPASALSAVTPNFNLDAARRSFGVDENGKVIEGGFVDKGGYMGGWYREGVDVEQEAMAVASDIESGKTSSEVDYGMRAKANKPTAMRSERNKAPTFYSHMGKVIDGIKDAKVGASSVVSYLKGKGVKNEEIKWSGIEAFLEGKKSVTKEDLQEFVAGSMLQIEEEVKDRTKANNVKLKNLTSKSFGVYVNGKLMETYTKDNSLAEYKNGLWIPSNPKNSSVTDKKDALDFFAETYGNDTQWSQYKLKNGKNYRELLFKLPNSNYKNFWMGTHWGDENTGILAHARIQDFKVDGKKMLFVEEIQSDWHNEGRRQGYVGDANKEGAVPDAPFRDTYHEFVMKRLIRMAAENGYDTIGWTPSEVQSERWSEDYAESYRIEYDQDIPKFLNKYGKKWGAKVGTTTLDGVRGKKFVTDSGGSFSSYADALNAVVDEANELMREMGYEYSAAGVTTREDGKDTIVLDDIGSELGRITTSTINKTDVWSMDITDSMRDSVLYEGQALYSERNTGVGEELVAKALEKENARLKEDAKRLRELVRLQSKQTHGTKFTKTSVEAAASQLMKKFGMKRGKAELVSKLNSFYEYIASADNLSWEDIENEAMKVVTYAYNSVPKTLVRDSYAQEILDDLRGKKITLSEAQKQEAASLYGSYNAFRKHFMGSLNIVNEGGIPLDRVFGELSEMYPAEFPADATEGDEVSALAEAVDTLKEAYDTETFVDEAMQDREWVREIYESYWNVSNLYTVADRYQRDINKLRADHRNAMREVREKRDAAMAEYKAKSRATLKTVREKRDAAMAEYKAKSRERLENYRDKVRKAPMIRNMEKIVKDLSKRLEHPSAKTAIPEAFGKSVAKVLAAFDFSTFDSEGNVKNTKANFDRAVAKNAIKDLATQLSSVSLESDYGQLDLSPEMMDWLTQMSDYFESAATLSKNGFVVNKMSAEELQLLNKFLRSLQTSINQAGKYYTDNSSSIVDDATSTIEYLQPLTGKQKSIFAEKIGKIFAWDNATPVTVFDRLGKGGRNVLRMLTGGQTKMAKNTKAIEDFVKTAYTEKEARAWQKDTVTLKIGNSDYTVTIAHLMSLYCLLEQKDSYNHIVNGGGIRFGDIERKGKVTRFANTFVSYEDEMAIRKEIDKHPRAKEVAKKLQEFMAATGSKWGNEVSMKRFGYHAFTIPDYFPIRTVAAKSEYEAQQQRANIYALLNKSFTKERNANANNAVIVDDIFTVFNNHMSEMALYNAWALPVIDAIKWFNYKERQDISVKAPERSVHDSLRQAYGENADKYIRMLFESINNQGTNGLSEDVAFHSMRLINRVAVAGNIRVAVQQPFSITRAFEEINPKYVITLKGDKLKKAHKEMIDSSGMALWKSLGYYSPDVSRPLEAKVKKNETVADKFTDWSMGLAELGDAFTWTVLWNACKLETAEKNPLLKGDDLLAKTEQRFNDIILRTQVVDSVLTKSQWMRSKGFWHKSTSAFMSEPTTTYNSLLRQYDRFVRDAATKGKSYAFKKNFKGIAVTVGVFTLTQVINALVTAPLDALRDDDDYETYLEKLLENLKENTIRNLIPFNMIPFFNDLFDYFVYGRTDRADMQIYVNVIDLAKGIYKIFTDGSYFNIHKSLKSALSIGSSLSGMPFSSMMRDVVAIYNAVAGEIGYGELKFQTAPDKHSKGYENMYKALTKGDKDRAGYLYAQLVSNYVEVDSIHSGLVKLVKQDYLDGKLSDDQVVERILTIAEYTGKELDEDKVYWKMDKWDYAEEHGTSEGYTKYDDFYAAVETGKDFKKVVKRYTDNGVDLDALYKEITTHYKPLYKEASKSERVKIKSAALGAMCAIYRMQIEAEGKIAKENIDTAVRIKRNERSQDIDEWLED